MFKGPVHGMHFFHHVQDGLKKGLETASTDGPRWWCNIMVTRCVCFCSFLQMIYRYVFQVTEEGPLRCATSYLDTDEVE